MNDSQPITEIRCSCSWCDKQQIFNVPVGLAKRYYQWEEKYLAGDEPDESITEILPDMPAGDREMLISHTCEDCWDKFFG